MARVPITHPSQVARIQPGVTPGQVGAAGTQQLKYREQERLRRKQEAEDDAIAARRESAQRALKVAEAKSGATSNLDTFIKTKEFNALDTEAQRVALRDQRKKLQDGLLENDDKEIGFRSATAFLNSTDHVVRNHSKTTRAVEDAKQQSALDETLDDIATNALHAENAAELQAQLTLASDEIDNVEWLSIDEKSEAKDDFLSGFYSDLVERRLREEKEDPTSSQRIAGLEAIREDLNKRLDDGKYEQFPNMPEPKREDFREKVRKALNAEHSNDLGIKVANSAELDPTETGALQTEIEEKREKGNIPATRAKTLLSDLGTIQKEAQQYGISLQVVTGVMGGGDPLLPDTEGQGHVDIVYRRVAPEWPEHPDNGGSLSAFIQRSLEFSAQVGVLPSDLKNQIRSSLGSQNHMSQSWAAGAIDLLQNETAKRGRIEANLLKGFTSEDLQRANTFTDLERGGMPPAQVSEMLAKRATLDTDPAKTAKELSDARSSISDAAWLADSDRTGYLKEHIPDAMLDQFENLVESLYPLSSNGSGNRDIEQTRNLAWKTLQRQWVKSKISGDEVWEFLPPDVFYRGPLGETEWMRSQLESDIREFFHDQHGVRIRPDTRRPEGGRDYGLLLSGSNIEERIEMTRQDLTHVFSGLDTEGAEVDIEFLRGLEEAFEEGNFTVIPSRGTRFFGDKGASWTAQVIVNGEPHEVRNWRPNWKDSEEAKTRAAEVIRIAQIHDPESLPSRIEAHGTMAVSVDAAGRTTEAAIGLAAEFAAASYIASKNVAHDLHIPQAVRAVLDGVAEQDLGEGYLEATQTELDVARTTTRDLGVWYAEGLAPGREAESSLFTNGVIALRQYYTDANERYQAENPYGEAGRKIRGDIGSLASEGGAVLDIPGAVQKGLSDAFSGATQPWSYEPAAEGAP